MVNSMGWFPDNKTLVVAGRYDGISFFDADAGMSLVENRFIDPDFINCFVLSGDGKLLACTNDRDGIRLWNVNGALGHDSRTQSQSAATVMCFSPDGGHLVSGNADGTIWMWDIATRQSIFKCAPFQNPIRYQNAAASRHS